MGKNKKIYSEHTWIPMTLICLAGVTLLADSFFSIRENWSCLEKKCSEKKKTEIVDSSQVNYSKSKDSIYKELGIDKTKYTQKQLDSLVAEAYQTILW